MNVKKDAQFWEPRGHIHLRTNIKKFASKCWESGKVDCWMYCSVCDAFSCLHVYVWYVCVCMFARVSSRVWVCLHVHPRLRFGVIVHISSTVLTELGSLIKARIHPYG